MKDFQIDVAILLEATDRQNSEEIQHLVIDSIHKALSGVLSIQDMHVDVTPINS